MHKQFFWLLFLEKLNIFFIFCEQTLGRVQHIDLHKVFCCCYENRQIYVKKPVLRATQVVMVNQNFSVILGVFFVKCGVHEQGDTILLYEMLAFIV